MGRYNNRRTQAAAEALKNTPSRARFSKGPPNKSRQKRKGNSDNNDKKPKAPLESTARVIDKLQSRQEQPRQSASRSATSEEALDYVDVSKLDRLQLPEDILSNITNLLEQLGVKESLKNAESEVEESQSVGLPTVAEDDKAPTPFSLSATAAPFAMDTVRHGGGYSEYEDDVEEEDGDIFEDYGHQYDVDVDPDVDIIGEGRRMDVVDEEFDDSEESEDASAQEEEDSKIDENPAFVYLTQQLSFKKNDAQRACRAIEGWEAISEDLKGDGKDTVALAMDWLCLHLEEAELARGFQPNKTPSKSKLLSKSEIPLVGATSIKAKPHPSISLATDVISDKVWARSLRRQDRILKFVRLGFSHSEATQACAASCSADDATDISLSKKPALEDPALPFLLVAMRSKLAEKSFENELTGIDLTFAAEERENEREVLMAIFDEDFNAVDGDARYCITIKPVEPLKPPAHSDDCQLHVFIRPGYPVVETALFWFVNTSLPPSLLRQINEFVAKKALENLGLPSVFEAVNALSEALPALQLDFIREQRRKEFEAEQARMRKDAGHSLEQVMDNQYKNEKLGRRQRAKLKAAEKAYNRGEQQQKEEEDRLKRQQMRVERVREESHRVREIFAEQALAQREEQRIEIDAENAARAAMNAAFNRGESVEEARLAASEAKSSYLRQYNPIGEEEEESGELDRGKTTMGAKSDPNHRQVSLTATDQTASFMERLREKVAEGGVEEDCNDGHENASSNDDVPAATPTTTAFMERLRAMYDSAAKKKAGFHLADAAQRDSGENVQQGHVPRPVAVPSGEMVEVMNDVITTQQQQPWLISAEARVPTTEEEVHTDKTLSPAQRHKHDILSDQLKIELERKINVAKEFGKKHQSTGRLISKTGKQYHDMLAIRQQLPAYMMSKELVGTIASNQVTVIAGDTGCGKTTQVPQLVLDDRILQGLGALTNIIVTQPRRISAIGVSERIAQERTESVGETCGYSIKLERKTSSKTRLLLCTTGVLLRRLQCDPDLAAVSHVFVDEVHERDCNTDFLLIILRDLLARRRNLKLVLMSATLNADAFSKYFSGCPVVSIPGRAHPVKEYRLEDVLELTGYEVAEDSDYAFKENKSKPPKISKSALRKLYHSKYSKTTINSLSIVDESIINYELVADLLEHISQKEDEGAILVFMPGFLEIKKTIEALYKKEIFQGNKVRIYPLHSSLTTEEQVLIFEVPPVGVRKIVVATNIAETSITIPDVVFVVDSTRVKENRRDEMNDTPTLVECWASRAAAKQRRGRAGRVRPGIAYHLYSTHTFENEMTDYQLPEILRVGIEDLVLQVLVLDLGEPSKFLSKALDPPSDLAMSNSLQLLETLGAVECKWAKDPSEFRSRHAKASDTSTRTFGELQVSSELTALGFHLATLPVDPRVGKLIIYGSLLGCVDPAMTIAAGMSARSPFLSPFDQREEADEARRNFAVEGSDHLTVLNAFDQWKELKRRKKGNRIINTFLKENFLGRQTLHQMEDQKKQFTKLLKDIGFLPGSYTSGQDSNSIADINASNSGLIKAVLCAGLYPNIVVAPRTLLPQQGGKKNSQKVGECAFRSQRKGEVYLHPSTIAFNQTVLDSRYCCYHEIVKTSKTYARDATTVSPFALLLFGGSLKVYHARGIVAVDGWLRFRLDAKPATLIKYLRDQMEKALLQKIINPQGDVFDSAEGKALISSISILFGSNEPIQIADPAQFGGEIVRPWTGNDEVDPRDSRQHRRSGRGRNSGRGRGRGGPRS